MPAIEKFRRSLHILGKIVMPYGTTAPTMNDNGQMNVAHVSNRGQLIVRSGGSTYTLQFPTASNGTVTITAA